MSALEALISDHESSICRLVAVDSQGSEAGVGSGFATDVGILTAHHVIPPAPLSLRFEFHSGDTFLLGANELRTRITHQSPESNWDYALISAHDLEVPAPVMTVTAWTLPVRGRNVVYLGYPFGTSSLTASVGYVSSTSEGPPRSIRIDGSVNRGNSGGPLIDAESGGLIGMIVRAETGYLKAQFDQLVAALQANLVALERPAGGGRIVVGGIDPVDAARASQVALLQLAQAIERSANVGIGYAFTLDHLAAHL